MFPKCHSHDSLTSGLFPFLLSFSPSLHSALLQFPFSVFLFSIHTKPSEGWSGPQASCLFLRLVSSSWTAVLGSCALECVGGLGGAWWGAGRHAWLGAASSVSRSLVRSGSTPLSQNHLDKLPNRRITRPHPEIVISWFWSAARDGQDVRSLQVILTCGQE